MLHYQRASNQPLEREHSSAVSTFFMALSHFGKHRELELHTRNTDSEFVPVDLRTGLSINKLSKKAMYTKL